MVNVNLPPLNRYDLTRLDNMWLGLVLEVIADLIERVEMCDCQDCVLDVAAIAMNSLPPKYWVSGKFNAFTPPDSFLSDSANRRIAEESVLRALRLVEKNPHH